MGVFPHFWPGSLSPPVILPPGRTPGSQRRVCGKGLSFSSPYVGRRGSCLRQDDRTKRARGPGGCCMNHVSALKPRIGRSASPTCWGSGSTTTPTYGFASHPARRFITRNSIHATASRPLGAQHSKCTLPPAAAAPPGGPCHSWTWSGLRVLG